MIKRPSLVLLFLALAISVYIWTINSYIGQVNLELKSELLLRHAVVMLLISLPSGLILLALVHSILSLIGIELIGMTEALTVSLTCIVAGLWQWFVALPWLWRKWKARKI